MNEKEIGVDADGWIKIKDESMKNWWMKNTDSWMNEKWMPDEWKKKKERLTNKDGEGKIKTYEWKINIAEWNIKKIQMKNERQNEK